MPESTQGLVLKFTIDGKEALATLDLAKGEFVEIEKQINRIANTRTPMLQQFAKDLQTIDLSSEEASASILEFLQVNQLTEKEINEIIQQLEAESRTLAVNSEAWKQKVTAAATLRSSMGNLMSQQVGLNQTMQAGTPGVNQMRMAMSQFGYVLNDAQVFMVNFRMGLMGISNNIPMIVQNFVDAKRAGEGTTSTMKMITQSIMGGGGLIIGINALMLVINLLPALFGKTTKSIKEQKDEVEKLRDEYAKLTREQLTNKLADARIKASAEMFNVPDVQRRRIAMGLAEPTDQMKLLQSQVAVLEEALRMLGDLENIDNRLAINKQRLLDLNHENIDLYKDLGNTYDEIKIKLKQWIEADEKLIKSEKSSDKNPVFEKAAKELEAAQNHQLRMAEIADKGDAVILSMKKEFLLKQIELYEKYKQDVTGLLYELVETEASLQESLKLPAIDVASETEDIILKDILAVKEYEESLLNNSLENWYKAEDKKISAYENYTDLKLALDKEYAARKKAIENKSAENTLALVSGTLGQLGSLFTQHTAAYKILSIAQAIIDTYRAANVALASAPPPFNFIAMAGVIATGLKNVDAIIKVGIEHPVGFAEGGRLPKGKKGYIEGWHDEIIAPEHDFKSVINETTGRAVRLALAEARQTISIHQSSIIDLSEVKELFTSLKKQLDSGIKAQAFLNNREAMKIYLEGGARYRKGKI